jgi:hypothetical protein
MIPGVPGQIMDAFARVVETGDPAQFEFAVPAPKEAWYEARVRKDGADCIMALFLDVTARKTAETELWEGQHRKNFLLALGDRMRELYQQEAIEQAACEGLGRHLALGLVAVLDRAGEEDALPALSTCWRSGADRDGQPALALDRLGEEYHAALGNGRTAYLQPLLAEADGDIRPWAIVVPMRRWGRTGGAMLVRPQAGSRLRPGDIAFIEEVRNTRASWSSASRTRSPSATVSGACPRNCWRWWIGRDASSASTRRCGPSWAGAPNSSCPWA